MKIKWEDDSVTNESEDSLEFINDPASLVFVYWDSGSLKDRDQAGGYYVSDLKKIEEEPVEAAIEPAPKLEEQHCPCWDDQSAYCPKCKSKKTSDLRTNYDALLKDLKEERDIHYTQGNQKWVERLDQKIRDLEKSIEEKFPTEKQGGAQNDSEGLVVLDHTPPRANSGPDAGGKDSFDEMQDEWAEPVIASTKLNVFKRELLATPLNEGYDISQGGKKLFHIKGKDSKPMNKKQLEFCAQIELTRGLKQATLKDKVAFLDAGTKVYILAQDRAGKRVKFACMEQGLRGWAPIAKFAFQAKEGEMRKHRDHIDNTFGHNGKEMLVDCPNGSGNMVWLPINELLPIQAPPATPESLNEDLGKDSAAKCPKCRGEGRPGMGSCPECGAYSTDIKERKQSAKECPDCHGTFGGAEGETCPTCGRFAVQKEALRPALAPQILNRRQEVNAATNKVAHIRHEGDKWIVYNHDYTKQLGHYKTKAEAVHRLKSIEYWKNHKGTLRPFSKKVIAEVLTDPYQTLSTHITEMRTRMDQVNERLQNAPAIKTAGEDVAPEMDLAALFADLTQGIDLLESKLGGDDIEPELHKGVEELENKLWTLEEKLGLTPELSEHEKAEPEHKEVVEKAKEMDKEAAVVTDETIEETTNDPNATLPSTTLAPALPTIQNVQPTDQDNLAIPVPMPTSPPPPGQKWVYNDVVGAYVLMPETTDPSKLV